MKPVILTILDGWGLREDTTANAPALANTPTIDRLMATCPHATLITHGPDVGLPTGQMGNSEVGHTNIGAGRVVAMDLGQIDLSIEDGSFNENAAILDFAKTVKAAGGRAHLTGLTSDGGVHAHVTHMVAAAKLLQGQGLEVVLHVITDGRDTDPKCAANYLKTLKSELDGVQIATVTGRYFAMDRDNRWERVEQAYRAMVDGTPVAGSFDTAEAALDAAYARGETDEFVQASVIGDYTGMSKGDGLFFLNFRGDRAREILSAIGDDDFDGFAREKPQLSALLGMVEYSDRHNTYMTTAFPKREIVNTLGHWVALKGKSQFRLAETEKYPHVTFFLNGGQETPEDNEDRFMPKSPKVATYDLQPEMSAPEVTEQFVKAIEHGYDLIVVNFANPDMVGHTGDLDAAIAACEAVDSGLGKVLEALEKTDGAMLVIADHGNCETMVDPETGGPHTAHTTNLVPSILFGGPKGATLRDGRLADVAPTLLELMGLDKPAEMTGESLIQ
ncbi:2,3-bisphosphoglycerate-independent phosphoglycerate mutase [Tropicibacter naphthalenivorans]|uniref:2,3-bisphosphoglycerate-independent phosphoglycerate mutase n=1 Tax=Tropicibacter naphthalenivorans TaxID=441103 RepID=A0A0P1FZ73_9RHOB|nr:2,3-bisphosphoglycerate-independent phosphoglycerate mutase [Tropicibacter naphthalenivorans]CUH74715.1 2,3-bisphosphoglycerate-independent phosphoglycerate mutase [Tropicibacter naphthalenivorans]SMC49610.1 phosphoglycerate mutase [Tropicibacter naphthalenivorans]